jgi:hypothetical protein
MKAEVTVRELANNIIYKTEKVYVLGGNHYTVWKDNNDNPIGVRFHGDGSVMFYNHNDITSEAIGFNKHYDSNNAFGIALHEYRKSKGLE